MTSNAYPYDCIAFDLDGTLVDSLPDIAAAANAALRDLSLPVHDESCYRQWVGNGVEMLMRRAVDAIQSEALGGRDRDALGHQALEGFRAEYKRWNGRLSLPYAGALELLQALQGAGHQLACVTNKPHEFAVDLLRQLGMLGFFGHVLGGDSLARRKPDPMPLQWLAQAIGTVPQRLLLVGDSATDINTAKAAGAAVIAVTYGYNRGQDLRALAPDAVIDSLSGVTDVLQRAST